MSASDRSVVHTPGPWMILDLREKGEDCITIAMAASPQALCRIRNEISGVPLSQEDLANAKLIAAAPDMLAALMECVAWFVSNDVTCIAIDDATSAIEKATGEVV